MAHDDLPEQTPADYIKSHIRTVPDWPAPGVQFRDITPLLQDPKVFRVLIDMFVHRYMDQRIDLIAGLDARGFILGSVVAYELNIGFVSRMERGRPWLRLKLASSLDGKTALLNGESKWITGADARRDVQKWRAMSSAVITGVGTVLADNPSLTVRPEEWQDWDSGEVVAPWRVIVDSEFRTPVKSHLFASAG